MKVESAHAWFLYRRPIGDTSLKVSFLTLEYGILEAIYKGGRTSKKQPLLQPFMPLWLSLDARPNWYYVRQLESTNPPIFLKGSALFSALYLNELIVSILKPQDSEPTLFSVYVSTLNALSHAHHRFEIEPILRRFELVLLNVVGYALSLRTEAITGQQIVAHQCYQFKAGIGLILSQEGFLGAHILAFLEDQLGDPAVLLTIKQLMRIAIDDAMNGREIHSRKLFGLIHHTPSISKEN